MSHPPIVLRFHAPCPAVSMNALTSGRGRAGHRMMRPWKHAVAMYLLDDWMRQVKERHANPVPIDVHLTIPFLTERTRDPHNYYATVKPVIDGIVMAGLVPDDNGAWVCTTEPTLVIDPTLTCILRITDRTQVPEGVVPPAAIG